MTDLSCIQFRTLIYSPGTVSGRMASTKKEKIELRPLICVGISSLTGFRRERHRPHTTGVLEKSAVSNITMFIQIYLSPLVIAWCPDLIIVVVCFQVDIFLSERNDVKRCGESPVFLASRQKQSSSQGYSPCHWSSPGSCLPLRSPR